MEIAGKTFIVTGGSSGLGAATARRLAAAGGRVVVCDVQRDEGERVASECGPDTSFVEADVTSEDSVTAAVEIAAAGGALAGVVCCAGIATVGTTVRKGEPHSLELFRRTIEVNLVGTFNVIRLAVPRIAAREPEEDGERGVIVTTASVAAFDGQIGQPAYSASKGGVAAMTLPLARELARYGIRVVSIAPGIFDTPMLASLPEAARASLGEQVPFPPRLGKPDEYAALVQHIV